MTKDFAALKNIRKIHMIGIGGVSMSGIALILKKDGFEVTGSDKNYGDMVETLEKNGIPVFIGSNADLVKDADVVVYTSAINQHDPEFVRAKSLGIPTYERAKFLGLLLSSYEKPICISGTHGKTTTTSMVASIFIDANMDPNVQVGSKYEKLNNTNYRLGNSEYFILEACEYVDSFLNFPHHCATILNIEAEHLDYFSDIEDIKKSFKKFILMLPEDGILVINQDDTYCMEVLDDVIDELQRKNVRVLKFSLSDPDAHIYAKNFKVNMKGFYTFDVIDPRNGKSYNFYLTVPGIHNVYDALAAITTCYAYGIDFASMKKSLSRFSGAKRRFEYKKKIAKGVELYDDYAHHPTEIKATLAAAKQKEHNKVIAAFQPHTFSRTKELLEDFAHAFVDADVVLIMDIYAAREIDDGTISSKDVVDLVNKNGTKAIYTPTLQDIADKINELVEQGDIVLSIGAGNITHLADYFEDYGKKKKILGSEK
ncbi:MAG: UDP-N-acetylmuramate--L-alanine ligase [Clostridia bacterium]|nr:UDP-N-acetylmuramate--L-alanine ligase [Clostridia bacterium]